VTVFVCEVRKQRRQVGKKFSKGKAEAAKTQKL